MSEIRSQEDYSFAFFTNRADKASENKWGDLDDLSDILVIEMSGGDFVGALEKLDMLMAVHKLAETQA